MSEQNNNFDKEQIPGWYDSCSKCDNKYLLDENTSSFKFFSKQPEVSFLSCQCPNCQFACRIYDSEINLDGVLARGIQVDTSRDVATPEQYKEWLGIREIELAKEYEISFRHEQQIKKFGANVAVITEQAPDLFWEEMNSPQGKPTMPRRWV